MRRSTIIVLLALIAGLGLITATPAGAVTKRPTVRMKTRPGVWPAVAVVTGSKVVKYKKIPLGLQFNKVRIKYGKRGRIQSIKHLRKVPLPIYGTVYPGTRSWRSGYFARIGLYPGAYAISRAVWYIQTGGSTHYVLARIHMDIFAGDAKHPKAVALYHGSA